MSNNFNKRIEVLPQSIWELLNKIDEMKGRWIGGANLNPQALGRMKRSVLITSAGASTRIEGAQRDINDHILKAVYDTENIKYPLQTFLPDPSITLHNLSPKKTKNFETFEEDASKLSEWGANDTD